MRRYYSCRKLIETVIDLNTSGHHGVQTRTDRMKKTERLNRKKSSLFLFGTLLSLLSYCFITCILSKYYTPLVNIVFNYRNYYY